jgi:putative oxidoreductase
MHTALEGKTAVVTGASRGIGLAIAEGLSREGAQVIAGARQPGGRLADLDGVIPVAVDLATADGPRHLVERAQAEFGGVDVLVNNVGAFEARTQGFGAVTDDDWQRTFEINLFSAVRAIRAALPSLVERAGAIINVSSINARVPQPPVVDYAAAKAALTNLSRTLAEELGPQGVRVNTVSPGPTQTSAWEAPEGFGAALARASGTSLEQFLADFPSAAGLSTERMTEPEEVAAIVVLLASGAARNVNGSDWVIDGGQAKAA